MSDFCSKSLFWTRVRAYLSACLLLITVWGCGGGTVGSNPPVKALIGNVQDQTGADVPNAQVIVTAENSAPAIATTDASGDFVIQTNFAPNTRTAQIQVVVDEVTSTFVTLPVVAEGANVLSVILEYNRNTNELILKDSQFSSNEVSDKDSPNKGEDPIIDNDSSGSNSSSTSDDGSGNPRDNQGDSPSTPENNPTPSPTAPPEGPVEDYETMSIIAAGVDPGKELPVKLSGYLVNVILPWGHQSMASPDTFSSIEIPSREPSNQARYYEITVELRSAASGTVILTKDFLIPWATTWVRWQEAQPNTIIFAIMVQFTGNEPKNLAIRPLGDENRNSSPPNVATPPGENIVPRGSNPNLRNPGDREEDDGNSAPPPPKEDAPMPKPTSTPTPEPDKKDEVPEETPKP